MKPVKTVCPGCGEDNMVLMLQMVADQIGDFSLAGAQLKVNMSQRPVLKCQAPFCNWQLIGKIEGKHAVFDFPTT